MPTQANREFPSARFLLPAERAYACWRATVGEVSHPDEFSASTPTQEASLAKSWPCFGAIILLSLLMRLACFTGLIASDDLSYSYYAQQISTGHYVPEANIAGTLGRRIASLQVPGGIHFGLRYGVIVPLGIVYRFFGVSEWSTSVLPLAASTCSVFLLMMIAMKLYGVRAALIVGLLSATFPLAVRYSTILVPEPIAEFYILAAIWLFLHVQRKPSILMAALVGSALALGYLTKETAVFVALAVLIEVALSRQRQALLGLMLGLTIVVGVEHAYYLARTGDILFRYHGMAAHNSIVAGPSLPPGSTERRTALGFYSGGERELLWHWFKAYPEIMLWPNIDMGLHSLCTAGIILPGIFFFRVPRARLLLLWALLPLVYLTFGTSSFSRYILIPVSPRYIAFVYPPLFLLAGAIIDRYITSNPRRAVVAFCIIALVGVTGFSCAFSTRGEGWRTDEIKILRVIVQRAKAKPLNILRVGGEHHEIWERSMALLGRGSDNLSNSEGIAVTIQPDATGLPFVAPAENTK